MERNNSFTVHNNTVIATSGYMTRVYQWMCIGILLTALVSLVISRNETAVFQLVQNKVMWYGMIIAQFGIVMAINFLINRISSFAALMLFFLYSAITGVTFSVLFLAFTQASIQSAFFTTATGFFGLTMFGHITKKDLGPVGSFCTMGLFGLIGYSLLAMFFPSMLGGSANLIFSILGLLIFAGLTAYDTQKIKQMGLYLNNDEDRNKASILGALTLYLDFINMFIFILRLTGDRRR